MINDNDALLKNRPFRFLRRSQWRVRESDRWRVVRPRTHTYRLLGSVGEGAKGNELRGYSLTSFAANINQFRAHPPPLRRLILT